MQFELFVNPIAAARGAFPFVVILQSDYAETGRTRVVAFLAPAGQVRHPSRRILPEISHEGADYLVFLPEITNLPASLLRHPVGEIASFRDRIVPALDLLFLGF